MKKMTKELRRARRDIMAPKRHARVVRTQRVITLMTMTPNADNTFSVFVNGYMERWSIERIRYEVDHGADLRERGH
jgi:hypothetical protein